MLILRNEKFGGIAFNTDNAYLLHLDRELFSGLFAFLKNKTVSSAPISDLIKQLGLKEPFYFRHIKTNDHGLDHGFEVLNSPVLADICITGKCNLSCPHCYVSSSASGKHMSMQDFRLALSECRKNGVLQIALGGGETTLHPEFNTILKEIRRADIVPNLTTNGKELGLREVFAMARYAGAVALSLEGLDEDFTKRRGFAFSLFKKSILKLKASGIKLVFQITVSKENLEKLESIVEFLSKYEPYGFLFLAYKPQGRGKGYQTPLSALKAESTALVIRRILKRWGGKFRVGFDCCITPSLMSYERTDNLEGCSAGRNSIAIMSDLEVLPCSFLIHDKESENLRTKNLAQIWQGPYLEGFRHKIKAKQSREKCLDCTKKDICLGGCPLFDLASCHRA